MFGHKLEESSEGRFLLWKLAEAVEGSYIVAAHIRVTLVRLDGEVFGIELRLYLALL